MKITLVGYGKMGHEIERQAIMRGHEIAFIEDALINPEEFTAENLQKGDVVIEFTRPDSAFENYKKCFAANMPVVSGTTGWLEHMPEIKEMCQNQGKTFFYASNFSLGVNLFFKLNEYLSNIMNKFANNYNVSMTEIHHTQKLDKPSGTAITLAEGVLKNFKNKNAWTLEKDCTKDQIYIDCIREGQVPGTHSINYFSEMDDIEIKHTAHTRSGFALGAVIAAEFLYKQKSGFYSMDDMLKL